MADYTNNQIQQALNSGLRNAGRAVVLNGQIFIDEIVVPNTMSISYDTITINGVVVNITGNTAANNSVRRIVRRVGDIAARRARIRGFFQRVGDLFAGGRPFDARSDEEISAWFALDRLRGNINRLEIVRVGLMYNIRLGDDVSLCHIPAAEGDRVYQVIVNGHIMQINNRSNPALYTKVQDTFFAIYDRAINQRNITRADRVR